MTDKNKASYPLEVLTLVELTKNSKLEFDDLKSNLKSLIESFGIEVVYLGDIIMQDKNENMYDVCIILKFLSESSHIKYIESHGKNQMLNIFLNAVKSRYDLQLSSI